MACGGEGQRKELGLCKRRAQQGSESNGQIFRKNFFRRVTSAPSPVKNKAIVAGSGTFAVAVKFTPPAGHWSNEIDKLWSTSIPSKLPPIPLRKIVVTPPVVVTLQFMNVCGALQIMADAGTPDSMILRLCQVKPELLVKNNVPVPLAGDVNVKCVPTLVQTDPHTGSLIMILGSGMELASEARQERIVIKISSAARRFIGSPLGSEI